MGGTSMAQVSKLRGGELGTGRIEPADFLFRKMEYSSRFSERKILIYTGGRVNFSRSKAILYNKIQGI
jgi:hypothetical protein